MAANNHNAPAQVDGMDTYRLFLRDLYEYCRQEERLSEAEFAELLDVAQHSSNEEEAARARARLEAEVMRLVPWAIEQAAPHNIPSGELVGEGYEIVRACIKNYQPPSEATRGARFVTYVGAALLRTFKEPRTFEDPSQPIHPPDDVRVWVKRYAEAAKLLRKESEAEPDAEAVLEKANQMAAEQGSVGISMERMKRILELIRSRFVSLSRSYESDNPKNGLIRTREWIDIPDPDADVAAAVEYLEFLETLEAAVDALPARLSQVLRLRYGLDGGDELLLGDIGKQMSKLTGEKGISKEWARQLIVMALFKLRFSEKAANLRDFLDSDTAI